MGAVCLFIKKLSSYTLISLMFNSASGVCCINVAIDGSKH